MDIKRGVLWFVMLFSILTLWNNWGMYNGKPSMFAPKPVEISAQADNNAASANASAPSSTGTAADNLLLKSALMFFRCRIVC